MTATLHSHQPAHFCLSPHWPAGSTALTLRVSGAAATPPHHWRACGRAPLCKRHACMRVDGMHARMRRFWHDEKRFKGTGEDSLVQQELLRSGAPSHHMATGMMSPTHPFACMLPGAGATIARGSNFGSPHAAILSSGPCAMCDTNSIHPCRRQTRWRQREARTDIRWVGAIWCRPLPATSCHGKASVNPAMAGQC